MIYTYYNKELQKGFTATNLAGLSRASGVSYYRLSHLFRNGTDTYETMDYLIFRSELIKGKQRVVKQSGAEDSPPDKAGSFMDELLK